MQRIWNAEDERWESVRCLKKLRFSEQPGREFFLHRSFCRTGFTVTELQTGSAVCQGEDSMLCAVKEAKRKLGSVSKEQFQKMIEEAILKQVKKEREKEKEREVSPSSPSSSPDPFPDDRTGEPDEFREEDL